MSNIERLSDGEIEHLWDTRVGDATANYPFTSNDWLHFARAIESAVHAKLSAPVEVGEARIMCRYPHCGCMNQGGAGPCVDASRKEVHSSLVEQQAREIAQQRLEIEGLRLQLLTAERGTQEAARAEVLYRQAEHLLTEPEKALTDRLSRQGEVIKRAAEAIENMKDCEFMGLDWSDLARNALAELRSVEGV